MRRMKEARNNCFFHLAPPALPCIHLRPVASSTVTWHIIACHLFTLTVIIHFHIFAIRICQLIGKPRLQRIGQGLLEHTWILVANLPGCFQIQNILQPCPVLCAGHEAGVLHAGFQTSFCQTARPRAEILDIRQVVVAKGLDSSQNKGTPHIHIHSGKLTSPWKMDPLKMCSLLKIGIFHCYVSLLAGRYTCVFSNETWGLKTSTYHLDSRLEVSS